MNRMSRTFFCTAVCWIALLLPLVPIKARSLAVPKPERSFSVRVYLNPDTGRFWTRDSIAGNNEDPLSLHKYLYGADNPVNRIDPSGNDDIGDVMDTLSIENSFSSLNISFPSGSIVGTGGADITKILKKTMFDVQLAFLNWSEPQRINAETYLTIPSRGRGAWDIISLKEIGFGESDNVTTMLGKIYPSGTGLADRTVTVNKKVYYAGSVNYILWGTMCRAVHDSQVLRYGQSAWSLSFAKRIVTAWKRLEYGDTGETANEALAFTEYGYSGNLPSAGLSNFKPSSQEVDTKGDMLDWCWEPYKPRNP